MQGIGLRFRYFLISFSIIFLLSILTTLLNHWFLSHERLILVNQSLRDVATVLVDSDLSNLPQIDFDKADHIISDELGESRFGKFFIIRNNNDEILYKSKSVELLKMEDAPRSPKWITTTKNGKSFQILNLALPRIPGKTLQVGAVYNDKIMQPSYLTYDSLVFFTLIALFGSLTAYFLTSTLLRPIVSLNNYIQQVTLAVTKHADIPSIPNHLKVYFENKPTSKDEFSNLVNGLNLLVETINRNHKMTRQWTYQLAHELKTPIAILKFELEKMTACYKIVHSDFVNTQLELRKLNEIISSFLSWAELENSHKQKKLHGINVPKVMKGISERLNRSFNNRVKLETHNDLFILCSPFHFEQAFINLVQNALFYSPESENVIVEIYSNRILVKDYGTGLPEKVIERLGEPFNSGYKSKNSHGLGLAWVYSIAKLYQWEVQLDSTNLGTIFSVYFQSENN